MDDNKEILDAIQNINKKLDGVANMFNEHKVRHESLEGTVNRLSHIIEGDSNNDNGLKVWSIRITDIIKNLEKDLRDHKNQLHVNPYKTLSWWQDAFVKLIISILSALIIMYIGWQIWIHEALSKIKL